MTALSASRLSIQGFGPSRPLLPILAAGILSVVVACGEDPGRPEPFGPYECVERTATAEPPALSPPKIVAEEPKGEWETTGPTFTDRLCPQGQVPKGKPAVPNVAKGNPLIGPVEETAELFFSRPKEQAERIQGALRPFKEVYPYGPDASGEQELLPDPPGCNGVSYFGSCFYYGRLRPPRRRRRDDHDRRAAGL